MRIFDCVMLFNEIDMLETRFRILENAVDFFVVCESAETHSGQPKPYYFMENLDRFRNWSDMIIYIKVPNLTNHSDNSWLRERYHRERILDGLRFATYGDWVIVADCDEIPDPHSVIDIRAVLPHVEHVRFELDFYYYDLKHRVKQGWSIGASKWEPRINPNNIRNGDLGLSPYKIKVVNGGWHFSYFGGPNQIIQKVNAFMHYADPGILEFPRDPSFIEYKIKNSKDLFNRNLDIEYIRGDIPSSMPLEILQNEDRYHKLGWIPD